MEAFKPMLDEAFTVLYICSGFIWTGLWLINRSTVLAELLYKQIKTDKPKYPYLLPDMSAERDAFGLATAEKIVNVYQPFFSSPMRKGISALAVMAIYSI